MKAYGKIKSSVQLIIGFVLLSFFFFGCSQKEAATGLQGVENRLRDNEIQGRFVGPCTSSGLVGVQSRTALVFSGAKFRQEKTFYFEPDCSSDEIGLTLYLGSFKVKEEKINGREVNTIEFAVDSAQVEMKSETLAAIAGDVNYCGIETFEVGRIYEVTQNTGEGICFVTDVPVTFYGSYLITKGETGTFLSLSAPEVSGLATVEAKRSLAVNADAETSYVKEK